MTQTELETVFWRATMMCLGLDPYTDKQAEQKRVRISWPYADIGNTNWLRDENVVFLRVSPSLDTYGDLHDVGHEYDEKTDTFKEVITYHRAYTVMWVCYGPACDVDADTIRIGILREPMHSYLLSQNVGVQPHIRQPVRMPEQDASGEWWERCDLTADCYVLGRHEYDADYIEDMPEINIKFSDPVYSADEASVILDDEKDVELVDSDNHSIQIYRRILNDVQTQD